MMMNAINGSAKRVLLSELLMEMRVAGLTIRGKTLCLRVRSPRRLILT